MAAKPLPDQTYLRECFGYNPETGELWWKPRPLNHFKAKRTQQMQWTRDGYNLAGTPHSDGCGIEVGISTDGRKFLAHRIIWKLITGNDPAAEIDHKNNDPMDNRWDNLREATRTENNQNTRSKRFKRKPEHHHLPKGAFPTANGKFFSVIHKDGTRHYLGTFLTAETAHKAYVEAGKRLHGEYANSAD